jgi:ribosome production factor 1
VALQEIGPRFTLKLQWLKKGIPTMHSSSDNPMPLEFNLDAGGPSMEKSEDENKETTSRPLEDEEFLWARNVSISFHVFV